MADGDDLVIGENNQAQSTTQLVLGLDNPSTTILKVGTGGGASIGVQSKQGTLGKRRFHAHCGNHERKWRGARQGSRNYERAEGFESWLRRWNDGLTSGETRSGRIGR